ncbi:MAG: hypothetical protein A2623_12880 [Caulobacterales bacterium RIFCSPHIGHO2_01_FULL_70_19]|jgi:hypothetical protein|nr:MAG: hypothetical protein A2623_12880 [Caulobacterales bacterium RIFCSPHIGHO2_01_FULL_70_19]
MRRRGRSGWRIGGTAILMALAGPAGGQTYVGTNVESGLAWSVSAPEGASWFLVCRHPPVIYYRNAYDQRAWTNKMSLRGTGDQRGRLPLDRGWCEATKTGGPGPVGVAVARSGASAADAVRGAGQTASAGLL